MSLLNRPVGKAISKPQNQISDVVKTKAVAEVKTWLKELGLIDYHAHLLAVDLIEKVISDRIRATSPTAAEVHFNDAQKLGQLVSKAQEMADKLDSEDKLEQLLNTLCESDAQRPGNSI